MRAGFLTGECDLERHQIQGDSGLQPHVRQGVANGIVLEKGNKGLHGWSLAASSGNGEIKVLGP